MKSLKLYPVIYCINRECNNTGAACCWMRPAMTCSYISTLSMLLHPRAAGFT